MINIDVLLILNCIIYVHNFEKDDVQEKLVGKNIFEIFDFIRNKKNSSGFYPAEINEEEFSVVLNTIEHNKQIYERIKIVDVDNSIYGNASGSDRVVNVTFQFEDNLIIVYKGTAGDYEWKDNVEGTYNITDTKQQRRALKYFDEMVKKFPDVKKIYVSGHSKGGNKAQYIGVLRGNMSKLEKVYSFDGQGFNDNFLKKYNKEIELNKYKIFNICNEYDYVNILMHSVSNKIFIKSITNVGNEDDRYSKIIHRLGGVHSPYSMFKNENGVLTLNDVVEQSELMKNFEKLFEYYNANMEEKDNKFMYYRMSLLMMDSGKEVFGTECPTPPKGYFKRFAKLTRDFTKNESELSYSQIIRLFKPVFSDIGSIILKGRISK
ncbi:MULTISPECIES: Mbeg1-like protein [unclassified Parvimonas]|uniref:Mbeg1-like protein n=1 Tax=unclassified Parvimonas TaxID=1151464 RepID=UPI002B499413|nr:MULTISPECIES: Mbeg1-like protein [unclassified Parvimonas]MEB3025654.1 Mbeg1-like protein [Parvimonas sp. M13]MEB3089785.1 Mbeg1-like protein [Parvimonas sp. M20]